MFLSQISPVAFSTGATVNEDLASTGGGFNRGAHWVEFLQLLKNLQSVLYGLQNVTMTSIDTDNCPFKLT